MLRRPGRETSHIPSKLEFLGVVYITQVLLYRNTIYYNMLLFSSMININSRGSISASMIIPGVWPFFSHMSIIISQISSIFPIQPSKSAGLLACLIGRCCSLVSFLGLYLFLCSLAALLVREYKY